MKRTILSIVFISLITSLTHPLVTHAAIQVIPDPDNSSRSINPDMFGYNLGSEAATANPWTNPSFQHAVNFLKPGALRFPGGTVANYWDWQTGWVFPNEDGTPFGLGKQTPQSNTLENFQQTISSSQATPIFVPNLLTSNLDKEINMLKSAQNLGLPIKYIELGNEFYLPEPDNIAKFPTGADYGSEANRWITRLHQEFPNIKIAVATYLQFQDGTQFQDNRSKSWSTDLLTTLQGADALTIHSYYTSEIGNKTDLENSDVEKILGTPFNKYRQLINAAINPSPINIWITEYNMIDPNAPVNGTWTHGLAELTRTLLYFQTPKVALITNQALVGSYTYNAIFNDEHGFAESWAAKKPSKPLPSTTTPYSPTDLGWTFSLLGNATFGMNSTQKLTFSENPLLTGGADNSQYPSLIGRRFQNGNSHSAIITNLSPESRTLNISSLSTTYHITLSADPLSYINGSRLIVGSKGQIENNTLHLPPYSASLLTNDQSIINKYTFATISPTQTKYSPGSRIEFSFANVEHPETKDWIGVYPASTQDNHNFIKPHWVYTSSCNQVPNNPKKSGSCTITIPKDLTPPGTYQLRLLASDGFEPLAISPSFIIQSDNLPGDLNEDGQVNIDDYNSLITGFGTTYNLQDYNSLLSTLYN